MRLTWLVFAVLISSAVSSHAVTLFNPTADQFSITETIVNGVGQYTITNNSPDACLYAGDSSTF